MEREGDLYKGGATVRAQSAPTLPPAHLRSQGGTLNGAPSVVPDLSVDQARGHVLMRSGWGAVVEIRFARSDDLRHEGLLRLIASRLAGRTEMLSVSQNTLVVDFQIEDDGQASRQLVDEFAGGLARLLGDQVSEFEVRFNYLDPERVEIALRGERPNLRAL
jgi:hypothetical protein